MVGVGAVAGAGAVEVGLGFLGYQARLSTVAASPHTFKTSLLPRTLPGLACSRGSRLGARARAAAPALPPLRLRLPLLRLRSPASFPSLHHLFARNGFRRSPLLRLRVRRVPGGVGVRGGGVGVRGGGVGLRGGG